MKSSDVQAIKSALAYASKWISFQHGYNPYVGTQIAVRVDGKLILNEAFGMANIEAGEKMTTDHLFRIASHSKTFTGVAVMQLVAAGKLRLDDTIGQHISELKKSGIADVTVRQLLSHTGGVIRDGDDADWWELRKPFPDRKELLRIARKLGKVLEPNTEFKYSNIGFSLLGVIIENAAGESYRSYVTTNIINTLGLKHTGPDIDTDRINDYAVGYSSREHGPNRIPIEHIDTFEQSSATGFYSTAAELTDYFQAHLPGDNRLLSDASKREMQMKVGEAEDNVFYGLGIVIERVAERTYIGHSGGYPGHITMSRVDRDRRLSISVFTNSNDGPAGILCQGMLALINLALTTDAKSVPAKPKETARFEGRFATLWGVTDIAALGGRLYALSPMQNDPASMAVELEIVDESTLKRVGGSKFGSRGENLAFQFTKSGKIRKVNGGHTLVPIEDFVLPEKVLRPERP